jgi:hypothetical protein
MIGKSFGMRLVGGTKNKGLYENKFCFQGHSIPKNLRICQCNQPLLHRNKVHLCKLRFLLALHGQLLEL